MSRPPRYLHPDGAPVPSVTEILGRYQDPTGLQSWAAHMASQGQDYRAYTRARGAVGTALHTLVERHLSGGAPDPDEDLSDEVASLWGSWLDWYDAHDVRVLAVERPLVHPHLRYGGTPDLVAYVDGVVSIVDWKTSSRVRPEHVAQVGAYAALWAAHDPAPVARGLIVHLRTDGHDLVEVGPAALDAARAYFGGLLMAERSRPALEAIL